jgi:tetratricopeptide (TPR) repeat protein
MAQIESLRIISRKSVMRYKRTEKSIPEIAGELNVNAVLEGSVMRAGDRVRITVQLIQARPEKHLWAKNYERDLQDVLALQSEVAQAIAREIKIKLTPQEEARFARAPAVNPEAYQAYLRGIDYTGGAAPTKEDIGMAIQMFERAVELDPGFALAYTKLSMAYSNLYHQGFDRTDECLKKAKAAADKAFELQPDLPEAHLALGYYHYWCHKAYDAALREFAIAENDLPSDPRILEAIAYIWRRQGNFEGALDNFKKVFEMSPRDASTPNEIALTCFWLRRHSEAERYCDRSIFLEPDQVASYVLKAGNYWMWDGSLEKARSTLEEMPKKTHPLSIYYWCYQKILERNYQEALDWLSPVPIESFAFQELFVPKSLLEGLLYQFMNEPDHARASFDLARIVLEREAKERPDDARVHSSLGNVYAALGRKEKAIQEGKLAVELYPFSKDAYYGVYRVVDIAYIYTIVGEYDAALDQIEYLLSVPCWITVSFLRLNPVLDPLRDHPRFRKLLERNK